MITISAAELDEIVLAIVKMSNKVRDCYGLLHQQTASRRGIEQLARRSVLYLLSEAHGAPVYEIPHDDGLRRTG